MALVINFATLNVNSMYNQGAVTIGEVNQGGWSSHMKQNYGDGQYVGVQAAVNIIAGVSDSDVVDAPIFDSDYIPGSQNQQV